MKDLQKLSPEIVTINQSFEMEGADMDKVHIGFIQILSYLINIRTKDR